MQFDCVFELWKWTNQKQNQNLHLNGRVVQTVPRVSVWTCLTRYWSWKSFRWLYAEWFPSELVWHAIEVIFGDLYSLEHSLSHRREIVVSWASPADRCIADQIQWKSLWFRPMNISTPMRMAVWIKSRRCSSPIERMFGPYPVSRWDFILVWLLQWSETRFWWAKTRFWSARFRWSFESFPIRGFRTLGWFLIIRSPIGVVSPDILKSCPIAWFRIITNSIRKAKTTE
jgi:hypothetical protein